LAPRLILIEICSILARPVSLSVRIIANISCRHLLLFLCRSLFLIIGVFNNFARVFLNYIFSFIKFSFGHFVILIFFILESIVAFIQAYIFALLTCLYMKDAIHLH
jgi:F-type H+-transporting ATPase subunit a